MKKTSALRELIKSESLEFLMEAHNGISSILVEKTGFKGIWASGFSIASSMGFRDCNEMTWTQVLDIVDYMNDATRLPILLDADSGYGNFNNVRILTKKVEQRGVAGICIEDKMFPKINSFTTHKTSDLASIEEFVGKIKAAKDTQSDSDFVVIARNESFIVGESPEQALERAGAYAEAGADAILCHSKRTDDKDIQTFMSHWGGQKPVVIVPTTYYKTPTDVFRKLGVSLVIWANHSFRSSVSQMTDTLEQILKEESVEDIHKYITPIQEIFKMVQMDELKKAREEYAN